MKFTARTWIQAGLLLAASSPRRAFLRQIKRPLSKRRKSQAAVRAKYLVKWLALPYDESSWEWEDDLQKLAGQNFERELTKFLARGSIITDVNLRRFKASPAYADPRTLD